MNQSETIIKTSLPRMAADGINTPSIAVMIPCFNEEQTITTVVEDFKKALPQARIVVCDNGNIGKTPGNQFVACCRMRSGRCGIWT